MLEWERGEEWEGGEAGEAGREWRWGRWGVGGRAAAYTQQQLSALHFISQIIKDDYHLPF